jgi:hypothetical protein
MGVEAALAIEAARNARRWGRWAAARYCAKRSVPFKLAYLAFKLEGVLEHV